MKKQYPIEFSPMQDNEIEVIINDGEPVEEREVFGFIEKGCDNDHGEGLNAYAAEAGNKTRWFTIGEDKYPTARKALAAAKQWIRDEYAA